jgi:hypothetical protein
MILSTLLVAILATTSHAAAVAEGMCTKLDPGLQLLEQQLSSNSLISCKGSPGQLYNAGRYRGLQFSKNASVVVFPASIQDVSYTVQATQKTPPGRNYAFVYGAHSMTNASSSYDMVINLSYMNKT